MDFTSFVGLTTLLFGAATGKIFFEEEFNNDSWADRWVASKHVGENVGAFKRTTGQFFADATNTGLQTITNYRRYALSALFPEFSSENEHLVLQYSVKYEQEIEDGGCAGAYIKLFDCKLNPIDMHWETPYLIVFGPDICKGDKKFHLLFSNHTSKRKKIHWKNDVYTHIYTLIIQPNKTYQVLVDDKEVSGGPILEVPTYPRICGVGFEFWQTHSGTIFDNILVTDELAVAKAKRKGIGDWQIAEQKMKLWEELHPDERMLEKAKRKAAEEKRAEAERFGESMKKVEDAKRDDEIESETLIEAARKAEADRVRKLSDEDSHKKLMLTVYISASFAALTIVIVIISIYLVFRYRSKYLLTQEEVDRFMGGNPEVEKYYNNGNGGVEEGISKAEEQPYDKEKYEISPSDFSIDTTRHLGSGEFGDVCLGDIERGNEQINLAVKMTKEPSANRIAIKGLISEIKILSYVGEHEHIIKLEGAYTAKLRFGKLYAFLELCELGSLEKKLRAYKPEQKILNEYADLLRVPLKQESIEMGVKDHLLLSQEMSQDLDRWSREIAFGMEFLASKRVVHADLATRNILLNARKCVKIADFGLSRRIYTYAENKKSGYESLSWRWMAPESLKKLQFNEKTDIWAFGVTLWEMFTLGDKPYTGLSWNLNFATSLEQGLCLPEPEYNQGNIYSVMKRCWEINPEERPTFLELLSTLT